MKQKLGGLAALAILVALATPAAAQLTPYSQDFESLVLEDPAALANDGWRVFGNVFNADWSYAYGYGPFDAPNPGGGFSGLIPDVGQGALSLNIYSDYANFGHAIGQFIEANVFQEQVVGAGDVGKTYEFSYDAFRGNIGGGTTALAFFKTLDPNAGFALTNFITVDMTLVPGSWTNYSLQIAIDAGLEGQILQFGFLTLATGYEGSGIYYDNINFDVAPVAVELDARPGSCPNPINRRSQGRIPMSILGSAGFDIADLDVSTLKVNGVSPVMVTIEDDATAGLGGANSCGCAESGPDGWDDLKMKFDTQDIVATLGSGGGTYTVEVSGMLLDGTEITGADCVIVVGGGNSASAARQGFKVDSREKANRGGRDSAIDLQRNE